MLFNNLRTRLTKRCIITTIKDKFAQLIIYGNNSYNIEQTYQSCGSNDDVNVLSESWLMNLNKI